MTRKAINEKQLARLASVQNEADCIMATLRANGRAWLKFSDNNEAAITGARREGSNLLLQLFGFDATEIVPPSSVLPRGRAVWVQIELMEAPKK